MSGACAYVHASNGVTVRAVYRCAVCVLLSSLVPRWQERNERGKGTAWCRCVTGAMGVVSSAARRTMRISRARAGFLKHYAQEAPFASPLGEVVTFPQRGCVSRVLLACRSGYAVAAGRLSGRVHGRAVCVHAGACVRVVCLLLSSLVPLLAMQGM